MHRQLKQGFREAGESGFTMVELLLVIVVIGVIASISVPYLGQMSANADFRADARNLVSAFKTARMEAVKRDLNCSITFSTDANGLDIYTVYVDDDGDLIPDAGEEVIVNGFFQNAVVNNNNIDANANGDPSVTFNGRGMPFNDAGGFGAGTVILDGSTNRAKNVRSGYQRSIVLSSVGRIRII